MNRRHPLGWTLFPLLLVAVFAGMGGQSIRAEERGTGSGVELTVYNSDLALVKDRRQLEIPAGIGNVNFSDVSSLIDPTSVKFRSISVPSVNVLEQNYEYDIVSSEKLLQKYLGQKISITTLKGENIEGYLLGVEGNLIISSQPGGGQVKMISGGQIQNIAFPELPGGLVVRPTLVWLVQNPEKAGLQQVEVTYLTSGLSWKADYVAVINSSDDKVDLIGWVTLDNKSGATYNDARLKLIAGDVNRVQNQETLRKVLYMEDKAELQPQSAGFQEQSFFEYHLYTLGRTTTVKNNQTKQVELLTATSIPAKKRFVYEGAVDPKKIRVMLEFKNAKENNLGIPLPKGRVRVQKADSEGSLQFIGEDAIDHTPKDETLRLFLGNAFDITGERIATNVSEPKERVREETYKITLRNHKKEKVTVTVVEHLSYWTSWEIIKKDHSFTKTEADKAEFNVSIPADGEETITYTVRYKW